MFSRHTSLFIPTFKIHFIVDLQICITYTLSMISKCMYGYSDNISALINAYQWLTLFLPFTSAYSVKLSSYKRKETHSPHFGSKPIMFNTLKIINYCVQLFRNQYRPEVAIQNISSNNNQKLPTTCILKSLKNQVSSNFKKV